MRPFKPPGWFGDLIGSPAGEFSKFFTPDWSETVEFSGVGFCAELSLLCLMAKFTGVWSPIILLVRNRGKRSDKVMGPRSVRLGIRPEP